jgi:hypothetical protein
MADAGVAMSNEIVNTNAKNNEPVRILCVFIFGNSFQQIFFSIPALVMSQCRDVDVCSGGKERSQHVPMSKTVGG